MRLAVRPIMRHLALLGLASLCAGCSPVVPADHLPSQAASAADDAPSYTAEAARTDGVCSAGEDTDEAQEPFTWNAILLATCLVAGALATEYGCKRHLIEEHCPPGTVITKTVTDTWDKNKSGTVRIPCDVIETLICGTGGVAGGEILKTMCAGLI